jgi:putative membrane protein
MSNLTGAGRRFLMRGTIAALSVVAPCVHAHELEVAESPVRVWAAWTFEPGVIIPLLLAAGAYGMGVRRLPRRFHQEAVYFFGGWMLLAVALVSPVHRWGALLFSVHMTQHELLMIGAAPLLVLGRPGLAMLRALPAAAARACVGWGERSGVDRLWRLLTRPAVAWVVHAVALWCWHIPSWFEATLHHEWVHAAQHASFLGTALWFWHSIFRGPRRIADYGWGVFNLFFTAVHSSVLGALLTFAPRVWYPEYAANGRFAGLSPLEDLQLGGLVMWVPGGLVYLLAALALLRSWIHGGRSWPSEIALTQGGAACDRV